MASNQPTREPREPQARRVTPCTGCRSTGDQHGLHKKKIGEISIFRRKIDSNRIRHAAIVDQVFGILTCAGADVRRLLRCRFRLFGRGAT